MKSGLGEEFDAFGLIDSVKGECISSEVGCRTESDTKAHPTLNYFEFIRFNKTVRYCLYHRNNENGEFEVNDNFKSIAADIEWMNQALTFVYNVTGERGGGGARAHPFQSLRNWIQIAALEAILPDTGNESSANKYCQYSNPFFERQKKHLEEKLFKLNKRNEENEY